MNLEQRLQDIIRNVTLGRANREQTIAEITRIVDALCLGAQEHGYVKGKGDGYKEGFNDGREKGLEEGYSNAIKDAKLVVRT